MAFGATLVMLNKICTRADSYRQAKSAPSRFLCQKAGTQPPHIAGPLGFIAVPTDDLPFRKYTMTQKFPLFIEKFHIRSLKP